MQLPGIRLKDYISVDKVHSIHYFTFTSEYAFPGEHHDFWEIVYVDKGKVWICAEDHWFVLDSGSVYFHHPGQWHTLRACEGIAANIAVFTFSSASEEIWNFKNRSVQIMPAEKQLVANIISESELAFSTAIDAPYINRLRPRADAAPGAQQMVKLYLCQLMILFSRRLLGYHIDPRSLPNS